MASMTYPVVETFASIQGEGFHVGLPAVFVRFWGCPNQCSFCDSKYAWVTPRERVAREFTAEELVSKIRSYSIPHVVLTGGEPLLYDLSSLLLLLQREDVVEVETSGAIAVPDYLRFHFEKPEVWVTVSPKPRTNWQADSSWRSRADAWKFLVDETFTPERILDALSPRDFQGRIFLQPLAPPSSNAGLAPTSSREALARTIRFVMEQPELFRLSLQLHKLINVR